MRNRTFFFVCLAVFALTGQVLAFTIHVPADQPTIQSGIDAASTGDTILVAPGTYVENLDYHGRGIYVIGQAGSDSTYLKPTNPGISIVTLSTLASLGGGLIGLTVECGTAPNAIQISDSSNPNISYNVFRYFGGDYVVLRVDGNASPLIAHNIFYANSGISCIGVFAGTPRICNNTFANNFRGFFSFSEGTFARNNIVAFSTEYGIYGSAGDTDYNLLWNNHPDYSGGAVAETHDIIADPLFVDPSSRVYGIQSGSPCTNAGDPDPLFNDVDGTRADIGAVPYLYNSIQISHLSIGRWDGEYLVMDSHPLVSWSIMHPFEGTQSQYEIEISLDPDWTTAELWDTGPIMSTDTAVDYGGLDLPNHRQCYLRVRVSDGITWSNWVASPFHTYFPSCWHVPSQIATIQEAIGASYDYDTVKVSAGSYWENLDFGGKAIIVISDSGPSETFLQSPNANIPIVYFQTDEPPVARLSGFTLQNGSADCMIAVRNGSKPEISDNIFSNFRGGTAVVRVDDQAAPLVRRNLFRENGGIGCVGVYSGDPKVINNTFYDNQRGFFVLSGNSLIRNNIVVNSIEYGVYGTYADRDYNLFWNNHPDFSGGAAIAPHEIVADPLFVDALSGNFHLQYESPCIDAGDPNSSYTDSDGTVADLGVFAFEIESPRVIDLICSSGSRPNVVSTPTPTISWQLTAAQSAAQDAYELEVGTDNDWTTAEMWSSGQVLSSDTATVYQGLPLAIDNVYFMRLRAAAQGLWSPWRSAKFLYSNTSALVVPFEYGRIQAAIDAAGDFDSVLVEPGEYRESLDFHGKKIKVLSHKGPGSTFLFTPGDGIRSVIFQGSETSYTALSGFDITCGSSGDAIAISGSATPELSYNIFHGFTGGEVVIAIRGGAIPYIYRNIFYDNQGISCVGMFEGQTKLINNTFYGNARGFFVLGGAATIRNNIVTNSSQYGEFGSATDRDYNLIWNNQPNYDGFAVPAAHDLSVDPLFVDPSQHDFHLQWGSPAIDTGDPAPSLNDPDGTRSDIGALSTNHKLPLAATFGIAGENSQHILNHQPVFQWIFNDTIGSASAFQLQVGVDNDWTYAEMWDLTNANTSQTSVEYAGLPLMDGQRYYARVRVNDGITWGDWTGYAFRMNSTPSTPVPIVPTNGVALNLYHASLLVANSTDAEGDSLTYTFQIFTDSTLTALITERVNIPEGSQTTSSGVIIGLMLGQELWWRARASDGFQSSPWCPAAEFLVRVTGTTRVPEEIADLQRAIDFSGTGDTILVAPGDYAVNLTIDHKKLRLFGSAGRSATVLRAADKNKPVISILNYADSNTVISGFTVTGTANACGIRILASGPIISDCDINRCSSGTNGAGILCESGPAQIRNNIIHDNTTVLSGAAIGGTGEGCAGLDISGNLFFNNNCLGGAAISFLPPVDSITLRGNVIRHNSSGSKGGVYIGGPHNLIHNNTIVSNSYGLTLISASGTVIKGNIIAQNSHVGLDAADCITDYNDVWGNGTNYLNTGPVSGDISADPLFVNPTTGDYHLRHGSPCHDAGDPDGDFNDPDGSRNDIGAFWLLDRAPAPFDLAGPGNQVDSSLLTLTPEFGWAPAVDPDSGDAVHYELYLATDSLFHFQTTISEIPQSPLTLGFDLDWGTRYWWKTQAVDLDGLASWSTLAFSFRTAGPGDVDDDGSTNVADIVFIINYIFLNGSSPRRPALGDVNCDGGINIADAVSLVIYIFGEGPAPCLEM